MILPDLLPTLPTTRCPFGSTTNRLSAQPRPCKLLITWRRCLWHEPPKNQKNGIQSWSPETMCGERRHVPESSAAHSKPSLKAADGTFLTWLAERGIVVSDKRIVWMDCARGAAIMLVIMSHSITQLRFGYEVPSGLTRLSDALSPFRMPLLAFLSGMLVHLSLRKERSIFFTGKVKNLLWPYAIWTIICGLTAGANYTVTDYEFYISYLWYILYLFFFYIAAYLLRSAPKLPIILSALTLAALIPADFDTPRRFFYLMSIFFLGHFAHEYGNTWAKIVQSKWNWILIFPVSIAILLAMTGEGVRYSPEWLAASISGVILACSVAAFASRPGSNRLLTSTLAYFSHLGKDSLVYYVSHYPIVYGVIILFSALDATLWVAFPIAIVTALVCGYALVALRRRSRIVSALFTFPSRPRIQPNKPTPQHSIANG